MFERRQLQFPTLINKRGKVTPSNPSPNSFMQQNERKVPVVECLDGLARISSKELAITHFVKSGTLQNACSTRPRVVVGFGISAHVHIVRLMRAKSTQPNPSPRSSTQQNVKKCIENQEYQRQKPKWKMARLPCKDFFKGTCTNSFCEKWHPPECLFSKSENGCTFGDKWSYAHRQVDEQPSKKTKKSGDKIAVALLKITRQLGCLFHDMEHPKSSSILRKSSNMLKPIRLRHAKIRDQNPSLGYICPGEPHQRNPNAPKIEVRSEEETERQERYAREAASKMARCILKLKEKH